MVVGVFVPCYGSSILEFWMEHESLMLRVLCCSTRLAKEVPAKKEPFFEGSVAVCLAFFRFLRKEEPRSCNHSQNSGGILEDPLRNAQPSCHRCQAVTTATMPLQLLPPCHRRRAAAKLLPPPHHHQAAAAASTAVCCCTATTAATSNVVVLPQPPPSCCRRSAL